MIRVVKKITPEERRHLIAEKKYLLKQREVVGDLIDSYTADITLFKRVLSEVTLYSSRERIGRAIKYAERELIRRHKKLERIEASIYRIQEQL